MVKKGVGKLSVIKTWLAASKSESCPHCNRPYPPDIYVGGPRGGRSRQKIYEFVKANPHGVTRQQIEDAVYGDYEDGGPLTAQSSIYVMIVKVNRVLRHHGFIIRAERGRGALYTLQELKPTHRPNILSRVGFGTPVNPS